MTKDTTTVVREWTAALNAHDPDAAADYYADDCVFENYGSGRRFEGRQAMRDDVAGLFDRFVDLHIEITHLCTSDTRFAKEWVMTGTTGDIPGLPAGVPFRLHGVGTGEVKDGKLVSQNEYWTPGEIAKQAQAHAESPDREPSLT